MGFVHREALEATLRWLGAGQDVRVTGDIGSGRSTVLREVAESLRASGVAVVELQGTAGGDAVPLGALLTHPTLRPRSTVARWGAAEAAATLAEALDGRRGTVVVDDVHLLDHPTVAVLDAVARQRPDRVRVVTTVPFGSPAGGAWPELSRGAAAVPVRPLRVSEVASLLAEQLGGQVEGGLAATVTGRSGGNPRAAVGLVVAAVGSGAVAQVRGRWAQVENLESVPTEAVLHSLVGGMSPDQRRGLDALAWFGLLTAERARTLLGQDLLTELDAAGRIAVDEATRPLLVAVSPPVLAQALRAQLTGARRALLREQAEDLFGGAGQTGVEDSDAQATRLAALAGPLVSDDRPALQQVTIVAESVRTRIALWCRAWAARHDVASALPLLRLRLEDGMGTVDADEIFAGTEQLPTDDPEMVAAYVVLRGQWENQSGTPLHEGVLHDPGPSGRLVLDGAGPTLLRYLDEVYAAPGRMADADAIDIEGDVPETLRGYATIQQARGAIEAGAPDRALDILDSLGGWQGSAFQRQFTHRLDALRSDALLMVGQVDDAVAWGRTRLSAAYDELSPFGIRLAARGLATALVLQGDDGRALRTLSVVLRLGRAGPVQSPYDERIFGLAAALHARVGHHDLARGLLDELEGTTRPYVPVLDFMRPWARMEVEYAASGGEPEGEPLWSAGEDLWAQGRPASALFCWALTPQRLPAERLARLEDAFAGTHVPLLGPAVRLHRQMARGTSEEILEAVRSMRGRWPILHTAVATARRLAVQEGRRPLTAEEVADATAGAVVVQDPDAPAAELTARESEIVGLVRENLPNREIASRLFLSVRTVESHLYRAMQKLGVSDRHDLVG